MSSAPLSTSSTMALRVFDRDCAFGTSWANRFRATLEYLRAFTRWAWLDLDALGVTHDDATKYAWIVASTHQNAGHFAPSALTRIQPSRALLFTGNLLATPPISWAAAARSHIGAMKQPRLPRGTQACAMPPTEA